MESTLGFYRMGCVSAVLADGQRSVSPSRQELNAETGWVVRAISWESERWGKLKESL